MNLQQFKLMAEREETNTCNGWGFNGHFGKNFTLGIFRFRNAKWSYRHSNSTPYNVYFLHNVEVTKEVFLNELLNVEFVAPPQKQRKLSKPEFISKNPSVKQESLF